VCTTTYGHVCRPGTCGWSRQENLLPVLCPGRYGAHMGHGTSGRRQGWRVTSGQPDPATVEWLLRKLPTWFGIESSVIEYIESARRLPAYLAWPHDSPAAAGFAPAPAGLPPGLAAGVLLAVRHFPRSAEIYLMAVDPAVHRQGAGRALVTALESDLVADRVEFLQVKTLGPAHPDPGYARTRQFYASVGFQPLEEITGLWPDNPCLMMIKTLPQRPG
jgi:ribosomal protein S18 acetylase RimI-like enzyme